MKRILLILAALLCVPAFATTYSPVQLLNPAGSTSGQAILSTGPSTPPGWGSVALLNGANTWSGTQTYSNGLTVSGGTLTGFPGRLLNVQVFSSSGTYTPTTGTTHAIIRITGAGGGSGGTTTTSSTTVSVGSGGSAGSYAEVYWGSVSSQTVTIGIGGAAGAAGGGGGAGGASSVGSVVSCPGGLGGGAAGAVTPPWAAGPPGSGAACTVSGATTILSLLGGRGDFPYALSVSYVYPGQGGANPVCNRSYAATGANGCGAGGTSIGTSTTGAAGYAGSGGWVAIYEYQ